MVGFSFAAYPKPPNIDNSKTYNTYYIENNIKNQYTFEVIGRILDTRKTTTEIYGNYDGNNRIGGAGIRFTIKFGKSYEEKLIEELRKELRK